MKPSFNAHSPKGPPVRYSTGPLYSRKELTEVLASLARDGYQQVENVAGVGIAVYRRTEKDGKNSDICIYLDHLGCHPNNSGTMLITGPAGTNCSTVWQYAKEQRGPNPVMKFLRGMF